MPSFENEYERYWQSPTALDDGWVSILLLVLAIGAVFVRDRTWFKDLRPLAMKWVGRVPLIDVLICLSIVQ